MLYEPYLQRQVYSETPASRTWAGPIPGPLQENQGEVTVVTLINGPHPLVLWVADLSNLVGAPCFVLEQNQLCHASSVVDLTWEIAPKLITQLFFWDMYHVYKHLNFL